MGVLQLPRHLHSDFRQLKKKPVGPVEIDWSNPLTRGLILFPIFNTAGYAVYDAAQDRLYRDVTHGLSQSNFTVAQGKFGQRVDCAGAATTQRLRLSEDRENITGEYWTVLTGAVYTDAGKDHTLLHHGTTISSSGHVLIWADTLSGALRPSLNGGTTAVGANGSIPVNKFTVWGAGYEIDTSSPAVKFWVDGAQSGATGSTTRTSSAGAQPMNFANENGGSRQHKGALYFYAVWERELTPAEHRSFARDPYQFLKPASRPVYFLSEGGGSTTHEGSLTLGLGAALSRSGAWDAFVARQLAVSADQAQLATVEADRSLTVSAGAGQLLAAGVDSDQSLSMAAGVNQAQSAGVASDHSVSLSAGAGQSQSAGADIERAFSLLASVSQAQSGTVDSDQSLSLSAGAGQSQAGGSDFAGDLSLQAGASQAQGADAEIGGALTLSSGVGLSTTTTAVFEGAASLGISTGLNLGVQWVAETLATFAAGVDESYSYGATQDASLILGAGAGQSENAAAALGASLTLSAQLVQAQTAQTDWSGEITLAAQLDDGRSVTGIFGAAVTLSGGAGQSQVAGLTQEAQLALGAALSDALAAAIGQQSPTWQIITVPFENRTLTVAVELRTLKITR